MKNSFGEFLKQKRKDKNLTQKDLAKTLFVSESTVSKWEKNISHPDITLLPKLAEILDVTEHELITASIDKQSREEKVQAKKWRTLSTTWSMFFYISYAVALIPCFICNLSINKGLTWFWIVLSALLLAFTFTNLPKIIKKHKLILLPLSIYLALCLLLGVCCIYTDGSWFWIASLSVLFGMIIIFTPIYISKYKVFSKVKKYNDFVSVAVDFAMLNVLLVTIYSYATSQGYANSNWYLKLALPITLVFYLFLNILLAVRFLKVNKLIKTSIILFLIDSLYFVVPLLKFKNPAVQKEINQINVFEADFSNWKPEITLENNIQCIIFLTLFVLFAVFLTIGIKCHFKRKNKS